MKKLLTLSTISLYFTLNNEIYVQHDGVAMGSHSRPIISANVFVVELEHKLIPRLIHHCQEMETLYR